ncbi:MAG: hypothetical protein ACPL3E_01175, partial [Minisyncoccia bacterium]
MNFIVKKDGQAFLGLIILILVIYLMLVITYFNSNSLNTILSYKENLNEKVFYLAESGINYAIFQIKQNLNWQQTNG